MHRAHHKDFDTPDQRREYCDWRDCATLQLQTVATLETERKHCYVYPAWFNVLYSNAPGPDEE